MTTDRLTADLREITAQGRAYAAANQAAVLTYWHIGRETVERNGMAQPVHSVAPGVKTLAEQAMPKYGSTSCKPKTYKCTTIKMDNRPNPLQLPIHPLL